jgi:hypothetical protein
MRNVKKKVRVKAGSEADEGSRNWALKLHFAIESDGWRNWQAKSLAAGSKSRKSKASDMAFELPCVRV